MGRHGGLSNSNDGKAPGGLNDDAPPVGYVRKAVPGWFHMGILIDRKGHPSPNPYNTGLEVGDTEIKAFYSSSALRPFIVDHNFRQSAQFVGCPCFKEPDQANRAVKNPQPRKM